MFASVQFSGQVCHGSLRVSSDKHLEGNLRSLLQVLQYRDPAIVHVSDIDPILTVGPHPGWKVELAYLFASAAHAQ